MCVNARAHHATRYPYLARDGFGRYRSNSAMASVHHGADLVRGRARRARRGGRGGRLEGRPDGWETSMGESASGKGYGGRLPCQEEPTGGWLGAARAMGLPVVLGVSLASTS